MSRYSRQKLILGNKQKLLFNKTVTIIGIGALGTHSAELLLRAGIKNLILIDRDIIEESNLQRQTLFTEKDINKSKCQIAKQKLLEINSSAKIKEHSIHLDSSNINKIKSDLILDCTDNLKTRFLINQYCKKNNLTWIYSSAIQTKGYVMPIFPDGPCLECFLKETNLPTCSTAGILNTIIPTISSLQVTLALKILIKEKIESKLIYFNIWNNKFKELTINKNPNCQTCLGKFIKIKEDLVLKFCSNKFQIIGKPINLKEIKKRLKNYIDNKNYLKFEEITLFSNGRAIVTAKSKEEALSIYSKKIGN